MIVRPVSEHMTCTALNLTCSQTVNFLLPGEHKAVPGAEALAVQDCGEGGGGDGANAAR